MSDWHLIGPHRFRFQDEVLYFEPHGPLASEQADVWLNVVAGHFQRAPHALLLVDARDAKPPPPEVRRKLLAMLKERKVRPRIIGFGINMVMRAASRLVLGAVRQLLGIELEVSTFSTEAEAWACVDSIRRRRRSTAA